MIYDNMWLWFFDIYLKVLGKDNLYGNKKKKISYNY